MIQARQSHGNVVDPEPNGGRDYRAPLWVTGAIAAVALAALVVAVVAVNEARDVQDNWTSFQNEIFASGETAISTLNTTSAGLAALVDQPFVFIANVDQEVPIVASVPFNRTIEVPINTSIPINEVVETHDHCRGTVRIGHRRRCHRSHRPDRSREPFGFDRNRRDDRGGHVDTASTRRTCGAGPGGERSGGSGSSD